MTTIEVHGLATRVRLRLRGSRRAELADAVATAWSRCLAPRGPESDGGEVVVALLADGEEAPEGARVRGTDLDQVMQSLTQSVTTASIAAQTGSLFMLHAGAVADPATGRALAYAAPGGTGKTTLTRRLGARGAGYLTDETFGFTADGVVVSYPKPLSVRPDHFTGTKHELSPDALGLGATPDEAHLTRLVVLERGSDHGEPRFERLDLVSAIAALAPETSALSDLPHPLRSLAALLDARPPVVRLTYAEASDALDGLWGLLGESS